jgi:hypothetical protein
LLAILFRFGPISQACCAVSAGDSEMEKRVSSKVVPFVEIHRLTLSAFSTPPPVPAGNANV